MALSKESLAKMFLDAEKFSLPVSVIVYVDEEHKNDMLKWAKENNVSD